MNESHTVLIVEDEEELREGMRDALELNGYEVLAARDGLEAIEGLDGNRRICLVLLDLVMPRMNGWDFYAALRALPGYSDVPVIVHSSSFQPAPQGVTRVLTKPLSFRQLMSVVGEHCSR